MPKGFTTGKVESTDNKVKSEAGDKDINKLQKATKSLSESVEDLATSYTLEQLEAVIEAKKKDPGFAARMAAAKAAKHGGKKADKPADKKADCVEEGKDANLEAQTKPLSDPKKPSIPVFKPGKPDEAGKPGNGIQSKQGLTDIPGKGKK